MTSETYQETIEPPVFGEASGANLYEQALEPGVVYAINPDLPISRDPRYGNITALITNDRDGPDVAQQAGWQPDDFVLVDVRNSRVTPSGDKIFGNMFITEETQYMLVGKNYDDETGFKGIKLGETIVVGRSDEVTRERFNLSSDTSRNHFAISLDNEGKLTITDNNSGNGTHVRSAARLVDTQQPQQTKEEQIRAFRPPEPEPDVNVPEDPLKDLPPHIMNRYQSVMNRYQGDIEQNAVTTLQIVDLLKEVDALSQQGSDQKTIVARLAKNYHPDLAGDDQQESARRAVLFKILTDSQV